MKETHRPFKLPLTLVTLLHTTKGAEATIELLKPTKIATRKWHLERNIEEEEEEDEVWYGGENGDGEGEEKEEVLVSPGDKVVVQVLLFWVGLVWY